MRPRSVCSLALAAALLAGCASSDRDASRGAGGSGMAGAEGGMDGGAGRYGAGRQTPGSEEDFAQTVGDRIFFDTDRTDLDSTAHSTLARQVQWLQQYPNVNVLISGNCDERGTEEYNLGLGQRRAATDANFLAAQGVSAARLQTISYGKDRPVDPGNSPEAWAKDRNAITQVH